MGDVKTRTERLEFRLTPAEKATLERVAKTKRRTVSSLVQEWIEQLEKENPLWPAK